MGNKSNTINNEPVDLESEYQKVYKSEQPCFKYIAKHPKLNVPKYFMIKLESVTSTISSISLTGIIGVEIDEKTLGVPCSNNELIQFLNSDKSFMSKIILMNVDNRWKKYKHNNEKNENDSTLCCWFLNKTNLNFKHKDTHLGGIYNLHYIQVIKNKTLLITFKLIILSCRHPKEFIISPDSNYLLIFGEGCHFLTLPNIYSDIINNKLKTENEIKQFYQCNKNETDETNIEIKNKLFEFQTYPTISMSHFINDHLLICVDYYDSNIGIVPSEQKFYLLDLYKPNTNQLIKVDIFGNQDQFVTCGQGLIIFSSGKYTKYSPKHLIKNIYGNERENAQCHLWIYQIYSDYNSKVIGHNYKLESRLQANWKRIKQTDKCSQIVCREFDGMNVNKYWFIHLSYNIKIFDIPSCNLTWIIPNHKFNFSLTKRFYDFYSSRIYTCSYGIVLIRTIERDYGYHSNREESDFALHPVPFWDYEILSKLLIPYVEYINVLTHIILSYVINVSLDKSNVTSHLRYIESNCLVVENGLKSVIIMAPYWDKKQINNIKTNMKSCYGKRNDLNENNQYKYVLFKANWANLMEYQYPPPQILFKQETNCVNNIDEKGSFLSLCNEFNINSE
eukprot:8766_1